MIYWLGVNVALLAMFGWSSWYVNHAAGDDFGAVFPVLFFSIVGGLSCAAYFATAVWLHRFL